MRDRKGRRIDGSERRKEGKEDRPEDVVEMIVVGEDSWGGRGGMDTEGRKRSGRQKERRGGWKGGSEARGTLDREGKGKAYGTGNWKRQMHWATFGDLA